MPQFDLASFPGQMFWLILIFALQYLIIAKLVVPGFKILFNKRRNYLDKQFQQAEEFSQKAEILRLDYEKKLEETKQNHVELTKKASNKIELESEIKLSELEKKFLKETKQQEERFKKINQAIDIAINEVTLDLATNILTKLTQVKVSKKKLVKYIN